ncbi:MAG: hypothetical protein PSY14_06905 [bacterium]|nr:hypothetical protein [bacterium]
MADQRRPSRTLTEKEKAQVRILLDKGWFQHRIAAHFDVNQGRISEIKTGKVSGQFALNL